MDRRVLKTKEAIMKAFVELIAEKNFEQVTINEIAERANVNRGTVYLHYVDKLDLLDQCIEAYLTQLFESCMPAEDTAQPSAKTLILRTFKYLEQHAFIYTTLLTSKGVPTFRNRLMEGMQQGIEDHLDMSGINQDMNKEIMVQFLTSAAIGLLEWWIIRSMPYPAEDIVEQLWTLLERHHIFPEPA
ncbi:TetR family transcriptional regulator [Paenibacillus sp. FSL A5-0031]|uniref:TetR/AcrR family transcriptional regulator n=1 Tax=Paenibacillus sp. FSL A5-0031 TaxID=1920420 RepID=UPI00096EB55B|nr:TetR/AcrR family transcriptional regulator [Paenibacillus sp. FSL A5-0031]OME78201.1 TetR family transcriptional regulator [Paenibacillus sp. FSL A5-0031]